MKRPGLLAAAVLALCAICSAAILSSKPEPVYKGKRLTEWLRDLEYSDVPNDLNSREAIKAIGTNSLPWVLPMLDAHDSLVKARLIAMVNSQKVVPYRFMSAMEKKRHAICAVRALEKSAMVALPRLEHLIDDPIHGWGAMTALLTMIPESVPALTKGLTNSFNNTRWYCAQYLSQGGVAAQSAVPALRNSLKDTFPKVREAAARTLSILGTDPQTTVTAIEPLLSDVDQAVQLAAIKALAQFGTNAAPALGALRTKSNADSNQQIKSEAEKAIESILSGVPEKQSEPGH